MQQRHPIAEYLDILGHELKFDAQISRRVRKEIEDHLWEAAAHEPAGDTIARQRRAIERLGSPRQIASQFIALSLLRRTQRVGTILILVSAAIFVTMKGRGLWYEALEWKLSNELLAISRFWLPIARYAFVGALVIGIFTWAYVSRRTSVDLRAAYRRFRWGLLLSVAAASLLLCTVLMDAGLTGLRLCASGLSLPAAVPVLAMAIEIAATWGLILQICKSIRASAALSSSLAGAAEG
jgi:hypothetical protein